MGDNTKCTEKNAAMKGGRGFRGALTRGVSHLDRRGPDAQATCVARELLSARGTGSPEIWLVTPDRVRKLHSENNFHLKKQS